MATETIEIGSSPAEEDCAQVGSENYMARARGECKRFIELLQATFGKEPEGAWLCVKSNPHDFGTYLEVVVKFDPENEEAAAYAYRCEEEAPTRWYSPPALPSSDRLTGTKDPRPVNGKIW